MASVRRKLGTSVTATWTGQVTPNLSVFAVRTITRALLWSRWCAALWLGALAVGGDRFMVMSNRPKS